MLAYVDASVWIAYTEGLPTYQNNIELYLDRLKTEGWHFGVSQAVMLETLYKPYREKNRHLIDIYVELFANSKFLPNYANLFDEALRIMKEESLKAMDSIHAALAAHYGCQGFVTTDADYRNLKAIPPLWIDLSLIS